MCLYLDDLLISLTFPRYELFSEQVQYLVDFVHLHGLLPCFKFPDEAQTHAGAFCQFNLCEFEQLPLIFYIFPDVHK